MKVKEKIRHFAQQLMNGAAMVFMWLLYLVVGLAIAVPYTYLAGWDADALVITALLLPIASVILYALCTACKMRPHIIPWWINRVFWSFLGYCLLPIFTNLISIVLKLTGFAAVGDFVFEYHYASLVAVPLAAVIVLTAYLFAKSFWNRRFSGNATPPSSTPPSGSNPNKTATISPSKERKTDHGMFQLVSA